MARKALDIGIRLERQEKKILKLRQELEEAQDLYEKLLEEKAESFFIILYYMNYLIFCK